MHIGKNVKIWPLAKLIDPITIGDNVIIDDFVFIVGGQNTVIGNHVHIASFTSCTGGGILNIEDYANISSGVRIFTGQEDHTKMTNPTIPYPYRQPIRSAVLVCQHAIIYANAVILPNVIIGTGAIIGALSLVKGDCKPWTIYGGIPAKPIGKRDKGEVLCLTQSLLNSKRK